MLSVSYFRRKYVRNILFIRGREIFGLKRHHSWYRHWLHVHKSRVDNHFSQRITLLRYVANYHVWDSICVVEVYIGRFCRLEVLNSDFSCFASMCTKKKLYRNNRRLLAEHLFSSNFHVINFGRIWFQRALV